MNEDNSNIKPATDKRIAVLGKTRFEKNSLTNSMNSLAVVIHYSPFTQIMIWFI